MPLGKLNLFGNQQALPPQSPGIPPVAPGQFGGNNYTPLLSRGLQKFMPMINNLGGLSGGMPNTQVIPGRNPLWEAGPQSYGGQSYPAPGYPPVQQPIQNPMPPVQSYPSQGFPFQQNTSQIYNQGYGQMPVQAAWEGPKKGGIKGFISNLLSKMKK